MENEKRLIPLKKRIIYAGDLWQKTFICDEVAEVRKFIEQAPTVDAVEVVRCKDCVHRKERVCFNPSAGMWVGVELKDSDFCSYGERRE